MGRDPGAALYTELATKAERDLIAAGHRVAPAGPGELRVNVDDTEVLLELRCQVETVDADGLEEVGVRARAEAPGGAALRLSLTPGHSYAFERALGRRDDLLGHSALDDRFIIKASDLPLASAWLVDLADRLLGLYDPRSTLPYRIRLARGVVQINRWSDELRSLPVVATVELAAGLAGGGRRLGRAAREAAAALGGRASGFDALPLDGVGGLTLDRDGVLVAVTYRQGRAGFFRRRTATHLVAASATALPTATMERRGDGSEHRFEIDGDRAWLLDRIDPAALAEAGGVSLATGRRGAELVLDGVVVDAERLALATGLLARVAPAGVAQAGGPYRGGGR